MQYARKKKKQNETASNGNDKGTTRKMSKDLRRSRDKRLQLLEAASAILARDPEGDVSLQDIAAEIGYTKGMVYYYFKSKGELLYHLYMYATDLAEDAITPIITDKTIPPRERLERCIYTQVEVMCTHWQVWRCFWWDIGQRQIPADLARIVRRRRKEYYAALTSLIEEAYTSMGRTDVDCVLVSRLIQGYIESVSRWYKTNGKYSSKDMARMVLQNILDGFFRGVSRETDMDAETSPTTTLTGPCDAERLPSDGLLA